MDEITKNLAYLAIDENVKDTTARQIVRYVMECEIWGQDTISPTNAYIAKKYNWKQATARVAISFAKKSQFITTTGRGKNRCLELNIGFLKGKMAEIHQKRPIKKNLLGDISKDLNLYPPNDLPNTLPNKLPNKLPNNSPNNLNSKKGLPKQSKEIIAEDNNNNNNNNNNILCETSSQDDQKDFKPSPSPSLIRKISLVEKAAAASKSFLSDMEDKDGIVALVEDENVTYPPNFNSQVAIHKLISPHENAKGKIVKPQRHIAVIGLYVLAKKMEVISDKQLASIIKRNVRAANLIKEYPFKRIIETMKFLVDKADFKWTLETVSKFIDEDLGKVNLNDLGKKSSGKVLGEDVMIKD